MGVTAHRIGWLAKGLAIAAFALISFGAPILTTYAEDTPPPEAPTEETTQATGSQADDNTGNWFSGLLNGGLALALSPVVVLSWAVFKIGSFLLGLAGIIFNWVTIVVIFKFAEYLGNSPGMLVAWGILRDFGNIALIFGFVYIGIQTILDIGHFNAGKSLAALVVAAVLMNFSLFAAEAVIDTANVLSTTLYEQSYEEGECNGAPWLECAVNHGIGGQILNKLTISSVFGEDTGDGNVFAQSLSYFGDPIPVILKFIGLALLVTIAAMVLFAGSFMLVSRGVVLAFLMVTSPIGLAGMAVSPLEKISKDWWKKLINQAFFAPVFLLLLLVSLRMTDGLQNLASSSGGLAAAISSSNAIANTGPLILFALVIGFMIGSLMIADKFGIYMADFATSTAGRLTYGTIGMIGRRTLGRGAYAAAQGLRKRPWARTGAGRLVVGGLDWMGKGNYDLRSNKLADGAGRLTKLDIGHGQHGGWEHIVHEDAEAKVKYGKSLKKTEKEEAIIERAKKETEDEKARGDMLKEGQKATAATEAEQKARWDSEAAAVAQMEAGLAQTRKESAQEIKAQLKVINDLQLRQEKTGQPMQQVIANEENKLTKLREREAREVDFSQEVIRQRKEALDAEKKFYADAKKSFDRDIEASSGRLNARTLEQAKFERDLNPARQFAKELRRELDENVLLRPTAASGESGSYKHAAHELEEWAGKSKMERAIDKMTETLEAQGDRDHAADERLYREIRAQDDERHGAERDVHGSDDGHPAH